MVNGRQNLSCVFFLSHISKSRPTRATSLDFFLLHAEMSEFSMSKKKKDEEETSKCSLPRTYGAQEETLNLASLQRTPN
jgi:hypothetical protein